MLAAVAAGGNLQADVMTLFVAGSIFGAAVMIFVVIVVEHVLRSSKYAPPAAACKAVLDEVGEA